MDHLPRHESLLSVLAQGGRTSTSVNGISVNGTSRENAISRARRRDADPCREPSARSPPPPPPSKHTTTSMATRSVLPGWGPAGRVEQRVQPRCRPAAHHVVRPRRSARNPNVNYETPGKAAWTILDPPDQRSEKRCGRSAIRAPPDPVCTLLVDDEAAALVAGVIG